MGTEGWVNGGQPGIVVLAPDHFCLEILWKFLGPSQGVSEHAAESDAVSAHALSLMHSASQ